MFKKINLDEKPLISVIIPVSQEAELTQEWCKRELKGIKHQIILAKTWASGYYHATGEFVAFMEKDCTLSKGYFKALLRAYRNRPTYRKLAMVCPAIGVNSWESRVYGFLLSPTSLIPSRIKSSTDIYLIQVGYIPGALIRKSVIPLNVFTGDTLMDSANLSIFFWNNGQHVAVVPDITYVTTENIGIAQHIDRVDTLFQATTDTWQRELVG